MILPIDFLFGLHFMGMANVGIYDLVPVTVSRYNVMLYCFYPVDAYSDVIWIPETQELLPFTVKGENRWRTVS